MKKMAFFIIVCVSMNTLTSDGAFKVQASIDLPQLEEIRLMLTDTNHHMCEEFDKLTSNLNNSVNKVTSSLDNSVNKTTSSFDNSINRLTSTLDNAINIFDPQNILLCLCGVICTYTGVTTLKNTPEQKIIGTTLTAIGITLTIFSKQILKCINS